MSLPSVLEPEVLVSADASGGFTGPNDDLTDYVLADSGITIEAGRDGAQQLSPPKIGDGSFDLSNETGIFSTERADSPYYQRFLPGRPIRYQAGFGYRRRYRSHALYRSHVPYRGRGVWPLGEHLIDDLDPTDDVGNRRVKVSTLGREAVLTRSSVTVGVMVTPLISECFTAVLNAVGWPTDKRDIATSDTRLLYWWCDDRDPWTAMLELLASEGPGTFGVRLDGTFYFQNRNYRSTAARSTTSQATIWDRIAGERTRYRSHVLYRSHKLYRGRSNGLTFTAFKAPSPYKNVKNHATYTTHRRTLASLAAIWSYGTTLALSSGQTITLIARPTDGNPFLNAVAPILTTDYTVAGGTVSISLSAASGLVAFITVTATSGTPTVSGLQLRAQSLVPGAETTAENSVDASASIAKFSPVPGQNIPIPYAVQGWPEIDIPNAVAVCDSWVLRYQVPRPQITITVQNNDGAHLERMLRSWVSDRLTLVEALSGFRADVWINALQWRITGAGGRTVELIVGCETSDDLIGAEWDTAEWDDVFAVWAA